MELAALIVLPVSMVQKAPCRATVPRLRKPKWKHNVHDSHFFRSESTWAMGHVEDATTMILASRIMDTSPEGLGARA